MALGFGSAAASASAFTSSSESGSDLRVVVDSDLRLVPARDPADTPDREDDDPYRYVDTDGRGRVQSFEFRLLNKRAATEFADLASIVNDGDLFYDRFELSFHADSAAVADALRIVGDEVTDSGDTYTIHPPDGVLGPGERVTFGLEMDFLSNGVPDAIADSDEAVSVTLVVDPVRN
jgi:hypothetical protein